MKEKIITLNTMHEALKVNSAAKKEPGRIAVMAGRYLINAKSTLGMTAFDFPKEEKVIYPDNTANFEQYLEENY